MTRSYTRTASLFASLLGAFGNLAVTIQLLSLWSSFKWDFSGDWDNEGSNDLLFWGVDGVKLAWVLLTAYFASSAVASGVGFMGITKNVPSYVRFYRDYFIADFSFCALSTLFALRETSRPLFRANACRELSRNPEFFREMADLGLTLENCEPWFERAGVAVVVVVFFLMMIRLHLLVAVIRFYQHLTRRSTLPVYTSMRSLPSHPTQRIYLLPSADANAAPQMAYAPNNEEGYMVYAPVPLSALSEQQARELAVSQAWIAGYGQSRHGRHHRSRSDEGGQISLPVAPGEGLLPHDEASAKADEAGAV